MTWLPHSLTSPTMGRGIPLPVEVHKIIVRLADLFPKEEVSVYTGVSLRSVERILAYYHRHGIVFDHSQKKPECRQRRQRKLRARDINVSTLLYYLHCGSWILMHLEFLTETLEDQPDLYLREMQELLRVACGRNASEGTIWKTLKATGLTMKKVSGLPAFVHLLANACSRLHVSHSNVLILIARTIAFVSLNMTLSSSCLWMKVPLIDGRPIVDGLGLSGERRHSARPFSCVGESKCSLLSSQV